MKSGSERQIKAFGKQLASLLSLSTETMKNHRFAKTKTGKHGKQLIHCFHTMDDDRFSIMGCQQKLSLKTRKLLLHAHTANLVKTNLANGGKPAYPSRHCAPALSRCLSVVADARVCCYPAALEECRRSYPGGQPIEGCLVHRFSAPGPHSLCGAGYHVSIILSGEYCITDMSVWNEVPRALLRPLSP